MLFFMIWLVGLIDLMFLLLENCLMILILFYLTYTLPQYLIVHK